MPLHAILIFLSFGNFVNRILKFVSSLYGGVIPESADVPGPLPIDDIDSEFVTSVNRQLQEYVDAMDQTKLRLGLQIVMLMSKDGNNYLQSSGLDKALMTRSPSRCAQVVSRAINLIYVLSVLIYPFMPSTSESILRQLNAPARAVPTVFSTDMLAGHTIGKPEHLFKKMDEALAEKFRQQFGGVEGATDPAPPEPIKGKKIKSASKSSVPDGPKSPEMLAKEAQINEQGSVVRALKRQSPKTPELEAQIKQEVDVLLKLKAEVQKLQLSG